MEVSEKKATITIIDDTPANLEVLAEMLHSKNYKVLQFPNGKMALNVIPKILPDLILLDITMPGIDGYEVCRRLKNDEKTKDIPVIFISALDSTADKVKAFSVGAVDYVPKPFQEEEVQRRVETHLEIHWMRKKLENQNQNLQQIVQKKVKEISDSQRATITALSRLTESRDYETGQHIERVQYFCKILAEKLADGKYKEEIDAEFIDNIFYAAPLHDIGKIGIRDDILLKPGRLNDEEFEEIKNHTTIGADTLKEVHKKYEGNVFIEMGIEIARYHHEKWDGSGYNEGLKGEEIPLSARIMAAADVYDALRSERPYKKPFSHDKAAEIIKSDSGTHFDPAVVDAFRELEADFKRIFEERIDEDIEVEFVY